MHKVISLKHWLKQALSPLGQFKAQSTEMISQRSVQATFKSGTLKTISKLQGTNRMGIWIKKLTNTRWRDQNHQVDTWSGSVWISNRRISFLKFSKALRRFIKTPYATFSMRNSHGTPIRYAHHSSWILSEKEYARSLSIPTMDHMYWKSGSTGLLKRNSWLRIWTMHLKRV